MVWRVALCDGLGRWFQRTCRVSSRAVDRGGVLVACMLVLMGVGYLKRVVCLLFSHSAKFRSLSAELHSGVLMGALLVAHARRGRNRNTLHLTAGGDRLGGGFKVSKLAHSSMFIRR